MTFNTLKHTVSLSESEAYDLLCAWKYWRSSVRHSIPECDSNIMNEYLEKLSAIDEEEGFRQNSMESTGLSLEDLLNFYDVI